MAKQTLTLKKSWHYFIVAMMGLISLNVSADCIGVVTAGAGVDFWSRVGEGARAAGAENGVKVQVRGPKLLTRGDTQHKIIEKMTESGCKELVVAPDSSDRIAQLSKLVKDGVSIVLIDRDVGSREFSVATTDNYKAGTKAAKEMIRLLPKGAEIGVLRLEMGVVSTTQREQGFIDAVTDAGLNIVIDDYLGSSITEGSDKAYKLLSSNPTVQGIFTPNESTTGMVLNMRKRVAHGKGIIHVGFDSHPTFIEALKKGWIHAIVAQDPHQMGYIGAEKVLQAKAGHSKIERIDIPTILLTPDTLHEKGRLK